jgi:DNA (cytosine-5)-methyltransferase 1
MNLLTHGSLFSGIGGFELGAEWAGIETKWNCEYEPFQRKILKKNFPLSQQHEDIRTLSHPSYVDIISGGFPCQDISIAGKGKGITGERSGLWGEMHRVIGEVRPRYVVIENSPMLTVRGFERVLCDLSEIGYDAEWQCLSGTTFGIQQGRERIYCIAYPREISSECSSPQQVFREPYLSQQPAGIYPGWRTRRELPEPRTFRAGHGVPDLVDRVGSLGNAVIPFIALYLFKCITNHHNTLTQ